MAVDLASFDVFLSHNSQDKAVVAEIGRRLQARGLTPWLDVWELLPGQRLQKGLAEGLARSKAVAVFLGANGLGPWQEPEMEVVLDRSMRDGCPVIPVLLPGSPEKPKLPTFLSLFVWVDLRGGLDEDELGRLVAGLRTGTVRAEEPEPVYGSAETRALVARKGELERELEERQIRGEEASELRAELREIRRQLQLGELLGPGAELAGKRYRLLELIGHGGFARVWKAWDRQLKMAVAIKVLDWQTGDSSQRRDRFKRGAREMHRLSHPGIVRVLAEPQEEQGHTFFVMELLEGGDLQAAVSEGRVGSDRALEAVLEVGEALEAAHRAGVIHRDVKPGNILLDGEGRPKLTDFDLVRAVDALSATRTRGQVGTVAYSAPEALENGRDASVAADVYSLAMTLCFAVTGREVPLRAIYDLGRYRRELPCSGPLRSVIERATALEPEERYPSVLELVQAARAALASPQIEVVPSAAPAPPQELPWSRTGEDQYGRWAAFEVKGVEHRMRWIPPGRFWMGSPKDEGERRDNEGPRHEVELTRGFWLGEVPCTQALWESVMGSNPSRFQGADRPVERVSWEDCQRFLVQLGQQHPGFRLPTEAEWEYAARAGTSSARYQGDVSAIAWYDGNSRGETHPVRGKLANAWGLHDMLGNVWEWCQDFSGTYSSVLQRDPSGPPSGSSRVIRGGSWGELARGVRAAVRFGDAPSYRIGNLGFRLARGQSAAPSEPELWSRAWGEGEGLEAYRPA